MSSNKIKNHFEKLEAMQATFLEELEKLKRSLNVEKGTSSRKGKYAASANSVLQKRQQTIKRRIARKLNAAQ